MSQLRVLSVIRYTYYIFIFSIPIETLEIGIEGGDFSVSKLVGIVFIATALLQPQVCFKMPPRPFWYFLAYILVCVVLAIFQPPQNIMGPIAAKVFTLVLLLVLFWVSHNLLQDKSIVKGTFLTLIGSCALLAVLMWSGSSSTINQGRVTTMSQNPNLLGGTLSSGLLALLGLAYGRNDMDARIMNARIKLLVWLCFGGIVVGLVATGSRKAVIGLLVGIFLLVVKQGHFAQKVQVGIIAILASIALVWITYENENMWIRWEKAILEGDRSGREEIHPEAWKMIMEKPFFGWGIVSNTLELGARRGWPKLDPHSLYLSILTETGFLGSIPFFIGLWICWSAAWKATHGTEGSFPVALMGCLLTINLAGSMQYRKLFWIILAYSLASESFVLKRSQSDYRAGALKESPHPVGYGP